jgi:hypothetical protein
MVIDATIEKFLRMHPATFDPREGLQKQSVFMVKMPTTPDERRFYVKMLTTLHAPFSPSEWLATLEDIAQCGCSEKSKKCS